MEENRRRIVKVLHRHQETICQQRVLPQQAQSPTNTREELLHEKRELTEIYFDFCRRCKNADPLEIYALRIGIENPINTTFRLSSLAEIEMRLVNLPTGSRTLFDEVNQRYIDEHNERLVFVRSLNDNTKNVTNTAVPRSLISYDAAANKLSSLLRRSIQTIGNLLINTSTASGTSPIEQLPADIWKQLFTVISKNDNWSAFHAMSVIPLLSKTIMHRCGFKEVAFVKAEIDDLADRCLFNYICNMSVSFRPVFLFVKEEEYALFEKNEMDLSDALATGACKRILETSSRKNSITSYGLVTFTHFNPNRITAVFKLYDGDNKVVEDLVTRLIHQASLVTSDLEYQLENDETSGTKSMSISGYNCKAMNILIKYLCYMEPPPGYVVAFDLVHLNQRPNFSREKTSAMKCMQIQGYENEPIKNMLLCTDVDDDTYKGISLSCPVRQYCGTHLVSRLLDVLRVVNRELSKIIYHGGVLSGFLEGNVINTNYGLDMKTHGLHLTNAAQFYLFYERWRFSTEMKWQQNTRQIIWSLFRPPPYGHVVVPQDESAGGILYQVSLAIQGDSK